MFGVMEGPDYLQTGGLLGLPEGIESRVELNNGVEMPWLGLGTFLMDETGEARRCVSRALEASCRLVDTASMYGNEEEVGLAIRESNVSREEVFVTTKLWNSDHGYDPAISAFHESLERLGIDYVDLYLIHWPVKEQRIESWRALETLYDEGLCRAIGVSNYMVHHLEELMDNAQVPPAVNQVQFHPWCYQKEVAAYCQKRDIVIEAYCPLARARKFGDPRLGPLADKYGKTPAQILLRWGIQHGAVVIPKTSHRERLYENADIFDFHIAPEDMEKLDSFNEDFHIGWDPTDVP